MRPRTGRRRAGLAVVAGLLLAAGAALFVVDDGENGENARDAFPELARDQALLSGRVIDAQTRAPVPGARLVIDQEGGRLTVVADAKGNYRSIINASRPIGFTVDAPGRQGTAGFGKLCPGERRRLDVELPPTGSRSAPSAPLVLKGEC